jgi:signal transduction histidine kinase
MKRDEAPHDELLDRLVVGSARERLDSARSLESRARAEDLPALRRQLRESNDPWLVRSLERGIARAIADAANRRSYRRIEANPESMDQRDALHELKPLVGLLKLYAPLEVPDVGDSMTVKLIRQLETSIEAFDVLSSRGTSPRWAPFDLTDLISSTCDDVLKLHNLQSSDIELSGPMETPVVADESWIRLALRNGLENAIDARAESGSVRPVLVTWAATDRDYWAAVLDWGDGSSLSPEELFIRGSSTKVGHDGRGLALVREVMERMKGKALLVFEGSGATRFEIRWPQHRERESQLE